MQKITLTLLTFFLVYNTYSQSFDQQNEPQIGDSKVLYVCDSAANSFASVTGSGSTWDYSNIFGYDGLTNTMTVINPSSSQFGTYFPASTKAISYENMLVTFFNSTATQRLSQGFVYAASGSSNIIANYSQENEILAQYPFALNNSVNDIFSGTMVYTSFNLPCSGSSIAKVDGIGNLIVSNSTISNVTRYFISDTVIASTPLGTVKMIRTQYEYYPLLESSATSVLPIFVHTTININNTEKSIVLSAVQPTQNAGISEQKQTNYSLFPNPSSGKVHLTSNFSGMMSGNIKDQLGRTIQTISVANGDQLDLSFLNAGMYIVELDINGHLTSERIVIK